MESIAVLGLAASIINIVDFATKVVSKGNKIYHAGDAGLSENHDLELATNDLLLLHNKLQVTSLELDNGTTGRR